MKSLPTRQHRHDDGLEQTRDQTPEARALEFVTQSHGQSLDAKTRAFAEPRFAHSLANIRIHSDAAAASVADGINSKAFTVGSDIVFNRNEHQMATLEGRALLSHELTHAIQNEQFGQRSSSLGLRSAVSDSSEREADAIAAGVGGGAAALVQSPSTGLIAAAPPWWMPMFPQTHALGKDEPKKDEGAERAVTMMDYAKGGLEVGELARGALQMNGFLGNPTGLGTVSRMGDTALEAATGGQSMMGGLGSTFSVLSGLSNTGMGISELMDGNWREGGVKTARGALDTASALSKSGKVGGAFGLASNGIGLVDGIDKMGSDDLKTATDGAQQTLQSGFGAIGSLGDMLPGGAGMILKAIGKPGELGAKVGQFAVNASDDYSKSKGLFGQARSSEYHTAGENLTGSEAAADRGRAVQDYFHSTWMPDAVGDVAGGVTAIGSGIGNAAYSGIHAAGSGIYDGGAWLGNKAADGAQAVWDGAGKAKDYISDNVTLDPSEIDWGRTFNPFDW